MNKSGSSSATPDASISRIAFVHKKVPGIDSAIRRGATILLGLYAIHFPGG